MRFFKSVLLLLLVLVGIVSPRQGTCQEYGNCDPGPNCTDLSNSFNDNKCFKCGDDAGYITKDLMCDGVKDCRSASDEDPNFCYGKNGHNRREISSVMLAGGATVISCTGTCKSGGGRRSINSHPVVKLLATYLSQ